MNKTRDWNAFKDYFRIMADKEDETSIIENISKDAEFHGANLWILIFAIFIASLGLNINSTAVIIGAMLISPLMGPIIGMGLAIGINDFELLKRSFKNYFIATIISIVTASIYFFISPFNELQSELLARTSPTLYDVLIAFCGGAAGIVAICTKGKGNVLPGVAIATALMPPLCTAGYGIASGHLFYFLGAFYLFFINTVFICLATYIGVRMLNFKHKRLVNINKYKKVKRSIILIVLLTMIPASIITFNIISNSIFNANINRFIKTELNSKGTLIIAHDIVPETHILRVVAVGKPFSKNQIKSIQKKMSTYNLSQYNLQIVQGSESDSIMSLHKYVNTIEYKQDNYSKLLNEQSLKNEALEENLNGYQHYERLGYDMRKQMKILFPFVRSFGFSNFIETLTDTTIQKRYVIAVIDIDKKSHVNKIDKKKLDEWIKASARADSVRIITTIK